MLHREGCQDYYPQPARRILSEVTKKIGTGFVRSHQLQERFKQSLIDCLYIGDHITYEGSRLLSTVLEEKGLTVASDRLAAFGAKPSIPEGSRPKTMTVVRTPY